MRRRLLIYFVIFTLLLSYVPGIRLQSEAASPTELIVNGGFESGEVTPWTGRDGATISVTDEEAYSGQYSLKVTNRSVGSSGPDQVITGKVKHGGEYQISAKVKYNDGPDQKQFIISIQYGPGWQGIKNVTSYISVDKGTWGTVSGNFTVPADADLSVVRIFVETPWKQNPDPFEDLMDFYVDEVSLVPIFEPDDGPTNLIINGDFETASVTPWTGRDGASISVTDEEAYSGQYSLKVTNRSVGSSGPDQEITGKVKRGGVYEISAKVKYKTGPDRKQFIISIQYGPGWQGIKNITDYIWVDKDTWGTVSGTLTVPADADVSLVRVFIETPWKQNPDPYEDLMDFYVDEVLLVPVFEPDDGPTDNLIINGDFETASVTPWTGRDGATISVTDEEAYSGQYSLKVTNRSVGSSGPDQVITGKVKHGGEYQISAKVKYNDGPDQKQFIISIQYGPGWQGIKNVTSYISVDKGTWGTVSGNFTVPADADLSVVRIFIETPWKQNPDPFEDLMDFYVDNVVMIDLSEDEEPAPPADPYVPPPLPSSGMGEYALNAGGMTLQGSVGIFLIDDRKVARLSFDGQQLDQALSGMSSGDSLKLTFSSDADIVVAAVPLTNVQTMQANDLTLELSTDIASYSVPLKYIDLDQVLSAFDTNVKIENLTLEIQISLPSSDAMEHVENAMSRHGLEMIGTPVEYSIFVRNSLQTVEWTQSFAGYVARAIVIPDDVDPSRITTAVVISVDGSAHPVPTVVVEADGRRYAQINSMSNSIYALVGALFELNVGHMGWAADAANDLGKRLVLQDSGSPFDLTKHTTRGAFASMIVRAFGLTAVEGAPSIDTAIKYGLLTKFVDGSYRLEEAITREEAIVMLSVAMKRIGLKVNGQSVNADDALNAYSDASAVSNWAVQYVVDLIKAGVLKGQSNDMLRPKELLTNAEAVTLIYRLLVNQKLI